MEKEILQRIKELVEPYEPYERPDEDYNTGNYDDTYRWGFQNGEKYLADQIKLILTPTRPRQ